MTLRCDWFVLCEQVLHDQQTSGLTLINCLDQVAAITFPANHPRFAFAAKYRWDGPALSAEAQVAYRLVRLSEHEDDEVVTELTGTWKPGSRRARVFINFHQLRLKRPETIGFRLDSRWDGGRWEEGPIGSVDVLQLELTPEQREALGWPPETDGTAD